MSHGSRARRLMNEQGHEEKHEDISETIEERKEEALLSMAETLRVIMQMDSGDPGKIAEKILRDHGYKERDTDGIQRSPEEQRD